MTMPASMDRLSGLPDEMIGHILSFLPSTKSFVQTSVLAKQWRFLWTRIPALGFTVDNSKSIIEEDEFSSWIKDTSTIFARNNMVIRLNYKLALPRFLFTSNNLVDLCIIDSGDISVEDTVYNFPALKKLQLVNVGYDSGDSLTHLISGCPVLEELIVQGTKLNYSDSSVLIKPDTFDKPTTIRYLRLRGGRLYTITHQARDRVLNILRSLLPPTSAICREQAHMVNHLILEPSTFRNLTQLDLGSDHWYFITSFLAFSKNLRVLTIHQTVGHKLGWTEHTSTNYEWVLMNHLETINLYDFEWSTKHEFEMVKFMLRKAKVLKTMDLIYTAPRYQESDWKNKVVALVRLASFKMKSLTCSIRLIGNNMRVVVTRNKRRARRNPRGVK